MIESKEHREDLKKNARLGLKSKKIHLKNIKSISWF